MSRFCLVLGGLVALSVGSTAAAPAVNANKEHRVHGTIVAVHKHSITVKTHHHKKQGQATAGHSHTRTFAITPSTKIQVGGKNQAQQVSRKALHKGEHVTVLAHNHQADAVIIQPRKRNKAT